uniref:Uncharacterized protein n=1 Tax=Arundo donax TaxID=35708 RepID=A0A0A9HJF6_ARUDO
MTILFFANKALKLWGIISKHGLCSKFVIECFSFHSVLILNCLLHRNHLPCVSGCLTK